jgi:hypothetical protein
MIRPHRFCLYLLTAALLCLPAMPSDARDWRFELAGGAVDEVDGKAVSSLLLSIVSDDLHPWEISVGHIQERHIGDQEITPAVNYLSINRRWSSPHPARWFWVSGLALVDGQSSALSSAYQFVNGPGWAGDRITISFRHMSNANLRGRNRGENQLLIAWRF